MIDAKIIKDSVSEITGKRLTTWVATYPRIILAEVNTHRVFSRNSASSRAIPVKKILEQVRNNPFMPTFWGKNQAGMQAKEELDDILKKPFGISEGTPCYIETAKRYGISSSGNSCYMLTDRECAKQRWLEARDKAVDSVLTLNELGLHKQIANRILEPWMYVTSIISSTEFGNYVSLRAHEDAQPEFQTLAYKMLDTLKDNKPTVLKYGEWHIPFGDKMPDDADLSLKLKIATARCARVSYLSFDGEMSVDKDLDIHDKLSTSGHWSPFEHCARVDRISTGNFRGGWAQYRAQFQDENRTDERVPKTHIELELEKCDFDA